MTASTTSSLPIMQIFDLPVDRRIEEVIKVDQVNEDDVYDELREYVVTDSIREQFESVLEAYRQTPNQPHESIGVWISGFFGSGKSSFAKILGYILEGRTVKGQDAADLFCARLGPRGDKIQALLGQIREHIPTTAIIFDVATERGVVSGGEQITAIMYKALLARLDYATDLDLAQLEVDLEASHQLEEFERRYREHYGQEWRRQRLLVAVAINQASAIMHQIDSFTYPAADTWARTPRRTDITPNQFAERVFDLTRRRLGPNRTIVFVIDEVGRYVSRSSDKMLDLQGVVQALGRRGKGKAWIAVTSQERLDEIVDSLEGKKIELATVKDRFPNTVDLAPSDIQEVTSKRVLSKRSASVEPLRTLYDTHKGTLTSHTRINTSARAIRLDGGIFVDLYPFLPYQIDLVIDIVSGLRNQPGASRQTGGANRTIIKLAQQVLINPQVQLGAAPIGALVTLDMIYDLVEGNVGNERRIDIGQIEDLFADQAFIPKVAKAICLLQFVRGVPRSAENIAAVLYPSLGTNTRRAEVEDALRALATAQKVRESEHGWELLSVEGKQWEEERQGIAPSPADLERLKRELGTDIVKDLKPYRYLGVRNFSPAVSVNGEAPSKGDIPFDVRLVDESDLPSSCSDMKDRSRQQRNTAFWAVPLDEVIYAAFRELHRTRKMIDRHDRRVNSPEEGQLLTDEKNRQGRILLDLRNMLSAAFLAGTCFFDGREFEADELASDIAGVASKLLADIVPRLYDKFELAAVAVKGDETKALFASQSLSGLPDVFYDTDGGLGLIGGAHNNLAISTEAPVVREILTFIEGRAAYGDKASGKHLESHFGGQPYGWDFDVVVLVVASLFRAGAIDLTSQGRRYTSWTDPAATSVLTNAPKFRASSFSPREGGVGTQQLVAALQHITAMYGDDPVLETSAIAATLRARLRDELPRLAALTERLRGHYLPGWQSVDELRATLAGLIGSDDDAAVRTFAESGTDLREQLGRTQLLETASSDANLETLRSARRTLNDLWPELLGRDDVPGNLEQVANRLVANLATDSWPDRITQIATDTQELSTQHGRIAENLQRTYREGYETAIDAIAGRPDFDSLPDEAKSSVLRGLRQRLAIEGQRLDQFEQNLRLLPTLAREAELEIERIINPKDVVQVSVSGFLATATDDVAVMQQALKALGDYCEKLISEGKAVLIS